MGDENPIRTLGDYSKPSHEGYRNTIELPVGNNVVPLRSDTIRLVQNGCSFHGLRSEDPNQHLKDFLKLVDSLDLDGENRERTRLRLFQFSLRDQASNWLERLPAGSITTWEDLTTRFLAQFFPPGRTAKLHNDILMFQQHHGESLSKTWTRFKDLLQKVPHHGIDLWLQVQNFMTMSILSQDEPLTNRPVIYSGPHDTQYCMEDPEQSFVEYASSRTDEAGEGLVSDFMASQNARLSKFEADFKQKEKENKKEYDNPENIHVDPPTPPDPSVTFINKKVLKFNSFYESLGLVPPSSKTELICTKEEDGDVMFIEIIPKDDNSRKEEPKAGGHVHVEKAYIDLNSPLNIMTRMMYNWIMRRKLDLRENANGGVSNFTGRIKGMHVFVGNFTYIVDFMIIEDISSIIDPRQSQLVLGKPFVEISNMTHDPPDGVVRFTNGNNEVAYRMPHKIEQYDSLLNLEKEHIKSIYLRNEEDKRRGVEYVMNKILGFYKECLELEPEYLTRMGDKGEDTGGSLILYQAYGNLYAMIGTDISQKDEKPSKKRQNQTRDGKVCEDEAQSKSSQLREEKAKKNIT
ncbi:MAK10-like protein [Tanacetum coccineum]